MVIRIISSEMIRSTHTAFLCVQRGYLKGLLQTEVTDGETLLDDCARDEGVSPLPVCVISVLPAFPSSEEAMRKAGTAHTKSSSDMENHVYIKAKTRVSMQHCGGGGFLKNV